MGLGPSSTKTQIISFMKSIEKNFYLLLRVWMSTNVNRAGYVNKADYKNKYWQNGQYSSHHCLGFSALFYWVAHWIYKQFWFLINNNGLCPSTHHAEVFHGVLLLPVVISFVNQVCGKASKYSTWLEDYMYLTCYDSAVIWCWLCLGLETV